MLPFLPSRTLTTGLVLATAMLAPGEESSTPWAYGPRNPGAVPAVKNEAWPANPIDHYILARLKAAGLTPSPEADRATLIRRLALDLTGLPPVVGDVDGFARDLSIHAYERVVDKYLATPQFAESWAGFWLERAGYADAEGDAKESARPGAWRWRDWVISSIGRDVPFDRFTTEQLAGDLLPKATKEQQLATAFHAQPSAPGETGGDPEEARARRVTERANQTANVWLGLSLACSQCHRQPDGTLTPTDFQGLRAFFHNAEEDTVWIGKNFEKEVELYPLEQAVLRARAAARPAFGEWLAGIQALLAAPEDPVAYHPLEKEKLALHSETGNTLEVLDDGSIGASGPLVGTDNYTVRFPSPAAEVTGFRIETLVDESLPNHGPGSPPDGNFVLSEFRAFIQPDPAKPPSGQPLSRARADFSQQGFEIAKAIDGSTATGWAIAPEMGRPHHADIVLTRPLADAKDLPVMLSLVQEFGAGKGHLLARFRVLVRSGGKNEVDLPEDLRALAAKPERTPAEDAVLFEYFATKINRATASLQRDLEVKRETAAVEVHVLREGNRLHGGAPHPPAGLPAIVAEGPPTRLDLARWIVAPENPLTARVAVNEVWSHLFGSGLVSPLNAFSARESTPSHPELLDWLAEEFLRNGWSRKQLIRTIVMSQAYRQASAPRPEGTATDPENRLYHRQNRFRVEPGIARDLHLAASGLLDRKTGGPSVPPPSQTDDAGTPEENVPFRRTLYTFSTPEAPAPESPALHCPKSEASQTLRTALGPQTYDVPADVRRIAEVALARLALAAPGAATDADRLTYAFRRCLARPPAPEELIALTDSLAAKRTHFAADENALRETTAGAPAAGNTEPAEFAAWIEIAGEILKRDDFTTRE